MARPDIVIIAALTESDRVIGKDNKLPWHISEDLKRFKRLTLGNPVLMGRNTFESIIARNGRPLPERKNIVLSTTACYPNFPEVSVFPSLDAALQSVADENKISVIGGESLYAATLPLADRLELTIVEGTYEGDAFFPPYEHLIEKDFRLENQEVHEGFRFESYVRD